MRCNRSHFISNGDSNIKWYSGLCTELLSLELYIETPNVCKKYSSRNISNLRSTHWNLLHVTWKPRLKCAIQKVNPRKFCFTLDKVTWEYFVILYLRSSVQISLFCWRFLEHCRHVSTVVLKVRWISSFGHEGKATLKHDHNDTQISRCYVSNEHWLNAPFLLCSCKQK
jgi:hypothetical protein